MPFSRYRGILRGKVLVLQRHTIEDKAHGIAEIIRRRAQNGEVEAGRVIVLAPRRKLGYAIRDALNAFAVFAFSFFHEEVLDEADAQEAFTLT